MKLIRILFLLLLIQFVATACSDKEDCTGTPADGFQCYKDNGCCEEIPTSSTTKKEAPTDFYCHTLSTLGKPNKICYHSEGENVCSSAQKCNPEHGSSSDDCPYFPTSFGISIALSFKVFPLLVRLIIKFLSSILFLILLI